MKKTVIAVVVTYNRKEQLAECVGALLGQTCKDMDILVVDNASTDGTREMLEEAVSRSVIRYANTGENLGGAGGFNYGLRTAAELGYEFAWLMDDDAVPEKHALEKLMEAAGGPEVFGFLSGKVLWTDGSICMMNRQRDLKLRNLKDYGGDRIRCGAATFVSLLVPISVVKETGLPIREFFIWADDLEYTRRISRKYPCYMVPGSVVVHKCAGNTGGNIAVDTENRIRRYEYAYRNEVYVYRREGARGILHLILRTPLHILRVLVHSPDRKWERIRVILRGTLKGVGFRPEIESVDS